MKKTTAILGVASLMLTSCTSPLERTTEQQLREQLLASNRAYLESVSQSPVIELKTQPSEVERELPEARRAELDRKAGPASYESSALQMDTDLTGVLDSPAVALTLQQAIQRAVQNNLDVSAARLQPAITEAQTQRAEAVFDAVYFNTFNMENTDTDRPRALSPTSSDTRSQAYELTTGIRKPLSSGGELTIQSRFAYNKDEPTFFLVDRYYEADVSVSMRQPILRNFGADVNRAEIMLARNARRQAVEDLRRQLLEVIGNTEQAYWELVFARQRLLIQVRLLERTIEDRDRLKQRERFDASPVRLTEANSFVELRRADVIRAQAQVRSASDALKVLIHSQDLPVSGETQIKPLEFPADMPVTFNLLESVGTALRNRPDLQRALYEIDDAAIRQKVADNQRLPRLDLTGTLRYNGQGDDLYEAYGVVGSGAFIDYLFGAEFEVPIGNRGPEALYRQRQLERRASVVNYRRVAQEVIKQVKDALRELKTSQELIRVTRAARLAAADNLRAIEEQEQAGVALTPEFLLDLKLSAQSRLADAETQEVEALVRYNISIARYYQTMGTLLQRNNIDFSSEGSDETHSAADEPMISKSSNSER